MAVSLYHQGDNLDRERLRQLTGQPAPDQPANDRPDPARTPVRDWLVSWIDRDVAPEDELDSLPGVMWHLSDAWARRDRPNIVLVHYADLLTDLEREMRRLAARLEITVPAKIWPALIEAATFERMRLRADRLAPDPSGVLRARGASSAVGPQGQVESCSRTRRWLVTTPAQPSSRPRICWPGSTAKPGPYDGQDLPVGVTL